MTSHGNEISSRPISPGRHLLQGAFLVFLAEGLLPLTAIVTSSFLTRKLGAGDYGLLTLSATLITWIEFSVISLFSRATVKIIGDSKEWQPAGAAILRMHLCTSLGAMAVCWALARPCSMLLHEPKLAIYLTLFAIDIPIFAVAHCHRSILIGRGMYGERARAGAARWITRLLLILLLVGLGLSVIGAILGSIGASLVELAIGRYYVRPSWSQRTANPVSLWDYAVPIFFAALIVRLMGIDIFLLKLLGCSAAQAGIYGAAVNASFVMPGIVALSLSPLLLSTIARLLREGDLSKARALTSNAIRILFSMLPVAVVASGASNEIAILLFGTRFAAAGPLIAILIFAGLATMVINLMNALLIASGRPARTLTVCAPLLPLALAGHLFAIPRFGPIGAAVVTTSVTCMGAIAGLFAVRKSMAVPFPFATFLRALLLSAIVYPLIQFWPTPGLAVIAKMAAGLAFVTGGFIASKELTREEIGFFGRVLSLANRR